MSDLGNVGPLARPLVIATVASALLASVTACGTSRFSREGGAVAPLSVRAVEWNPTHADVGRIDAITDDGDDVTLFGAAGATIFSGGTLVATDKNVTSWRAAATIGAPDATGRWMVGIDDKGRIFRVRTRSKLELVSDRFALGGLGVDAVASLGGGFTAFDLPGRLALADGKTMKQLDVPGLTAFGGGAGHALLAFGEIVRDIDAAHGRDRIFHLEGARYLAVGDDGRLYAATEHELYAEDGQGRLQLRYETSGTTIHGLVASQARVWFADGGELGVIDPTHVAETTSLGLGAHARLSASTSGGVWTLDATVGRYDLATAAPLPGPPDRLAQWSANVQPAFSRACAGCHLPGGAAGIDLSTPAAWEAKRALIHERVVDTKSMPPKGSPISDADRAAIDAFTK